VINRKLVGGDDAGTIPNCKAMASFTLLTSCQVSGEPNVVVFHNKHASLSVLLDKIKKEARLWVMAGAKRLSEMMSGE
jgi:hypothetical protein